MKVLIADDHRLVLEGVRRALASARDIEVVAEATSGSQVLPLVRRTNPDLVLLDMRMPGLDGLACLEQLTKHCPSVKVIVLSAYKESNHVQAAFNRGASGYIVKTVNPVDLPSAMRQAVDGTFFSPLGTPDASDGDGAASAGLTDREFDILKALARGLSNLAIGKEFWVTEQTVKFHLSNIYRKLGVANRTEAARYAYERGLVEHPLYEHA
jgi:DNA-binding NarL/FixJ family response regulator